MTSRFLSAGHFLCYHFSKKWRRKNGQQRHRRHPADDARRFLGAAHRERWNRLAEIMWVPYNPNPQNLTTGDCVIRAISATTGMDWYTIHRALCDLSAEMADWPNADRVWWEFLRQIGFSRQRLIDRCPDCYTVRDFARDHPRGAFILGPHEHAVAVINGDWWDSWDSGSTVPTYYFRRA